MNDYIKPQAIRLTGKASEVFEQLKAKVAEIEAKKSIYRTVIVTPETFVRVSQP